MEKINIIEEGKKLFDTEIAALESVKLALDENFEKIVSLIVECKGKVVITGMGKPGHIGTKIAATMASLGTPSFYLHPAEALHGDLGMLREHDVLIAISFSGESEEVTRLIPSVKVIGCPLVAITGNPESTLAVHADYSFVFPKFKEACSMNLAPTSSTTAALVLGDAFAVCASKIYGFNENNFALFHPAGSLGKKLLYKVSDLMKSGEDNAVVDKSASLKDAIIEMSKKALGIVNITDGEKLLGIFTDGDLRRIMASEINVYEASISEIMKTNPTVIDPSSLAVEAMNIITKNNISALPVVDNGVLIGTIRINDIASVGIIA